jgi:signal transduction histidine kinase
LFKRVIASLLLAGIIALLTVATWRALTGQQQLQVAQIAEAESYAARSQLIRNVDTMLRALSDIKEYWLLYGHLPREQWASDAGIELAHFTGIELILWSDPARGIRYARSVQNPVFDYRPTDEEWRALEKLDAKARQLGGDAILGPYVDDAGTTTFEVYMKAPDGSGKRAHLVAVVDSRKSFGHWLADESPGYAISVFWNDVLLHRQGDAAAGLPESWTREGMIRTSLGTLWRVVHQPSEELARTHNGPAITAVLWTGLAIAALLGLLAFENGRARSRALAAEAAEQKLADLNSDLEQQIADRVQELADRTLDLETITDSVAHDLRNPLNSISVNTQLMQQQFDATVGEEGRAALLRTSASVKRMTEILDRLLGLSVVSQSIFRRQRIDLREIVVDVFRELDSNEQPPAVELVVDDLPEVHADPVLVRTLIMNLLSNAIKYTREKKARRIEVRSDLRDGVSCYCIRDNGIGFDPESAERMFRAFERLDGSGEADGVGLGLDIAARVVKRHNGKIWAEGRRGEGAAIYFTLEPPHSGKPADTSADSPARQA